jgi:hypothetical protein
LAHSPAFDPERTWEPLEARIKAEQNPKCSALLEQVRDHMRAEIRGEFDPLMATLIDAPQYHLWGIGEEVGPKGLEAVSQFYQNMIASGGNRFEFSVERIVADESAVVTEGKMRTVSLGSDLLERGMTEMGGEPIDPDADYLSEWQILTVWPGGEGGRLIGEDIYFGSTPTSEFSKI